jgi:hypothetical protein
MKSASTLVFALMIIFTFPIWIGIGAGLFGLAAGLFGALIGIMGALFGAAFAVIAIPFKILFGWGHHGFWFPHFHWNGFLVLVIVVLLFLLFRKKN